MDVRDVGYPPNPGVAPVRLLLPAEPVVYEDLFTVGAIPSEICHLHNAVHTTNTPIADAILETRPPSDPAPPGPAIRSAATRLVVDRVPTSDGSYRVVVRQRQ
jgi:hypothetical protein